MFGIPFLIGTFFLLSIIVYLLFGKWMITLEKGAISVFVGVGPLGWTRNFTYDKESLVCERMTNVEVNGAFQKGICLRTGKKDFIFGSLLKEDAKQFIIAAIMKEIGED